MTAFQSLIRSHKLVHSAVCAGLLAATVATAAAQRSSPLASARELLRQYPGVRYVRDGGVQAYYGRAMTQAATPDDAAELWLLDHASSFGVADPQLVLIRRLDVAYGRFTAFVYAQTIDGLPVEYGMLTLLVLNDGTPRVVLAEARLARPSGQRATVRVPADQAIASVRTLADYQHLPVWSDATQVYLGAGGTARRVWKFVGEQPRLTAREKYTFFVDVTTGRLVDVRNEVLQAEISGTVQGNATPGDAPDTASNPPVPAPMPKIEVRAGSVQTFTDSNGNYVLTGIGGTVTVSTDVSTGQWVDINNQAGGDLSLSQSVTPPGPGDFLFNPSPSQFTTAQVNAFIHTTLSHDFIADRSSFTGLDIRLPVNVNIADVCNAFFDGSSTNFFQSGSGCVNTAYSTVVAHEYGHFIINQLGLPQGPFGEGYGDTIAVLLYDTGIIGRDFAGPGNHVRNVDTADQQYPCSNFDPHVCGQTLAGIWFDIMRGFEATYGNATGLEMARQLSVDWITTTVGPPDSDNSAGPITAVEVLTLDDDDGNLDNGTPHAGLICTAFENHGIDCPIPPVAFDFPDGLPDVLTPGQPTTIRVNVGDGQASPVPGTGTVSYRIGSSGSFTTVAMTELSPNHYEATLPAANCPETVQFFFTVDTNAGPASSPVNAPNSTHAATAAFGTVTVFADNFETDQGWTTSGNASTGQWERGIPVGCNRGDPSSDFDGSGRCYLTENDPIDCNSDVDNGTVRLISPSLDLSAFAEARIRYARWFNNSAGASPFEDVFDVEVRSAGGAWVRVERVGPSGNEVSGGWFTHSFNVGDFVPLSNDVQVRFVTADLGNGSIVEAAVDAFTVTGFDCNAPNCPGDLDGDLDVDLNDLSVLLANFGTTSGADPADGDLDGDGDVDLTDLSNLLANFGLTCG